MISEDLHIHLFYKDPCKFHTLMPTTIEKEDKMVDCVCFLFMEVLEDKKEMSVYAPDENLLAVQNRCVNIIAHLFNAPIGEEETTVGVGMVRLSKAIMLADLAFKRKWQQKQRAEGKPCDKPNIVTGANVQVGKDVVEELAKALKKQGVDMHVTTLIR